MLRYGFTNHIVYYTSTASLEKGKNKKNKKTGDRIQETGGNKAKVKREKGKTQNQEYRIQETLSLTIYD